MRFSPYYIKLKLHFCGEKTKRENRTGIVDSIISASLLGFSALRINTHCMQKGLPLSVRICHRSLEENSWSEPPMFRIAARRAAKPRTRLERWLSSYLLVKESDNCFHCGQDNDWWSQWRIAWGQYLGYADFGQKKSVSTIGKNEKNGWLRCEGIRDQRKRALLCGIPNSSLERWIGLPRIMLILNGMHVLVSNIENGDQLSIQTCFLFNLHNIWPKKV